MEQLESIVDRAVLKGSAENGRKQRIKHKHKATLVTGKHPHNHAGNYRTDGVAKTYVSERMNTLKPLTTTQGLVSAIEKISVGTHTRQNYASTVGINGHRLELAEALSKAEVPYAASVLAAMPLKDVLTYKRKPLSYSVR